MLWRRSYDVPPPVIEKGSEFSQDADARYADLGAELPMTECLKDVVARMIPYWDKEISADLASGKVVLVTAHGNSLRALVKHLEGISDVVGFHAESVSELRAAFEEAVTDYLQTCAKLAHPLIQVKTDCRL